MPPRGTGTLAIALLGLALAACLACYGTRGDRAPWDVEAENARAHRCDEPDCDACEAMRRWARDNPGRAPDDLCRAAESGIPIALPWAVPAVPGRPEDRHDTPDVVVADGARAPVGRHHDGRSGRESIR